MKQSPWMILPLALLAFTCAPPQNLGGFVGPGELSGTLSEATAEYSCDGQAGDVITVAVNGRSPGWDPQLWLIDPEGVEEAFDDDSGDGGNSLIREHTLLRTGVYTIRVGSYEDRPGEFTLSVAGSCQQP